MYYATFYSDSDSDSLFNINMYNYILIVTKKNINSDNYNGLCTYSYVSEIEQRLCSR